MNIAMRWNDVICFLVFMILYGCSSKITARNDGIDVETREEVHLLVDKVIEGLAQKETEKILNVSTESFKSVVDVNLLTNVFTNYPIAPNNYLVMDEYHQKNLIKGVRTTMYSGRGNRHDYALTILPPESEIYVSIGYFDVPNIQYGFCFVFVKQHEKWLLNYLNAGILQVARKDVVDWFEEAQKDYGRDEWWRVMLELGIIKRILDRNNLSFKYVYENELRNKGQDMFESIGEKIIFPLKIDEMETKPCVTGIVPRIEEDTLFLVIRYVTKLDIQDIILLEQECNGLHENIHQLFPGIRSTSRIYYQVFTEESDGKKNGINHVFEKRWDLEGVIYKTGLCE